MHYVIGLISAIAGFLWALNALQRSGFDPSSLNPFLFYRRLMWRKTYGGKPLYKLNDPIDVAAVLLVGAAKCKGEMSGEQKGRILSIFTHKLHLPEPEAADLLVAASYLTRDEVYIADNLDKILERTKGKFTDAQRFSMLALMEEVAYVEGAPNPEQRKLIEKTAEVLRAAHKNRGAW